MVGLFTTKKMKFSIKDFFSKCEQTRSFLKFNGKLYFLCVVIFPFVTVSRSNKTMNTLIQICTAITRKQIQS